MTLTQALQQAGVTTVYVIDDAYDQNPPAITANQAQAFVDTLQDAQLDDVCRRLDIAAESELDSVLVAALQDPTKTHTMFAMRADYPGAGALFEDFIAGQDGRRAQLAPLIELLKAHGVEPKTFGRLEGFSESPAPELVFIDLRMLNDQHVNVEQAVDVYRKLKTQHSGCIPFVFLMSSEGTTLSAQRDDFREQARLLRSQFESIEKIDFKDDVDFESKLNAYICALPLIRDMHQAVSHFELAVNEAGARLKSTLLSLDLADYFLLHANTAQVDGESLGVYLSGLLLEYLSHEVERTSDFWSFAKTLDSLQMRSALRMRCEMSPATWSIYSGTVLHAKERLNADRDLNRGPSNGYFYLGDIFFLAKELNDATPKLALVIITPACDLARPEKLKDRTILLREGAVTERKPDDAPKIGATIIAHPNDEKRQLQIDWDLKKFRTWSFEDIEKFKGEDCSFVNVGRLRPLHALLLQHALTNDLSRIGVARAPSMCFPLGLRAFVREEGHWRLIDQANAAKAVAVYSEVVSGNDETVSIAVSDPAIRSVLAAVRTWLPGRTEAEQQRPARLLNLGDDLSRMMYVESKVKKESKDKSARELVLSQAPDFAEDPQLLVYVLPKSNTVYKEVSDGVACRPEQLAAVVLKFVVLQSGRVEAAD
jgi:hypothetical protein